MDPQPITTVEVNTELSREAKTRAREITGKTPVVLLPHGGMGKRPETVQDLLDTLEHMSKAATYWINLQQEASDELTALKSDIKAARRVFKLMTEDDA